MSIRNVSGQQFPQQLQMFMTPAEIHAGWQGFDKDLSTVSTPAPRDPAVHRGKQGRDAQGPWMRSDNPSQIQRLRVETHPEMWERKTAESLYMGKGGQFDDVQSIQRDPNRRQHTGGPRVLSGPGSESLYRSVERSGVRGPVFLGTEVGSEGKPQITGGHHRIAAATNIVANNPRREMYLPVIHHEGGITEAWKDKRYA